MAKGLFSTLRRSFLPFAEKEKLIDVKFEVRSAKMNMHLRSLSEEDRERFYAEFRGILELRPDAKKYGARNTINPSPEDMLRVKETLYDRLYSPQSVLNGRMIPGM